VDSARSASTSNASTASSRVVARRTASIAVSSARLQRLQARYSPEALHKIAGNPGEAAQLLEFAAHGADSLDDLRRPPRAGDRLGEGLQPVVEQVFRPVAQLDGTPRATCATRSTPCAPTSARRSP
jgi:hypothetical protein